MRRRISGPRLPVWYSPLYRMPLSGVEASVGMQPRRADYVAWWLRDRRAGARTLHTPRPISFDDLDRVHTPELLDSLARPEALARIFATDPSEIRVDEIMAMVRLACGGTLEAARAALHRKGPALNLLGGFHHAGPGSAGGFCAANDVAVAVAALRAEGFGGRIAVLDLDAHPPDGIAACVRRDDGVWIGSISGSDWGALPGVDETVLREGAGDDAYLSTLNALLGRMPQPALAFVLAGGDVLAGDRFGRLGMTLAGARRRDLVVARALEGVPAVWLPAGGYHADSWRVLAGTALALTSRSEAPIPATYDPLTSRFASISRELSGSDLADLEFTSDDLEEALGLSTRGQRLFLGYYTAAGLEHALYRYGVLDYLRRLGYAWFRIALDAAGPGDRVRLYGDAHGTEHLLIELVAQRHRVAGSEVLYVHWMSLRNPRAHFKDLRPQLPGQEVPGLGLAREIGELLALMARRLELAAIVMRPAHYHMAYSARHNFAFLDASRQGRFEALVRDLSQWPLVEATQAVSDGRVLLDGRPYAWEADEMVLWLKPAEAGGRDEAIARERERSHFVVVPRPG